MKILSFRLSGRFAAFRDPSVTSNQTVYHVPSKSAIVGILGAMIGIQRDDNSLGPAYGSKYINFFSKINIGIRYDSEPRKITYFTNHRSFENVNMKPFKTELLVNPQYRIFILIENGYEEHNDLQLAIQENKFVYSPYLGQAYCLAVISDPIIHSAESISDCEDEITNSVILDESGAHKSDFIFRLLPVREQGNDSNNNNQEPSLMIERHLHHFLVNEHLQRRVLRYWTPVNFSSYRIARDDKRQLSGFYKIDGDKVVCMF